MRLKDGVRLTGATTQVAIAMLIAESLYRAAGGQLVVTSVNDSKHKDGSLHYRGFAVDLRLPSRCGCVVAGGDADRGIHSELVASLGPSFDVLLEDPGGPAGHIHVEYDPG
jgi:hypothetical protein